MNRSIKFFLLFFLFLQSNKELQAQDTKVVIEGKKIDSTPSSKIDSVLLKHSPRKATFRSAVLPGWGQYYNKKYWKIPVIYGGLGFMTGLFIYNNKTYKLLRKAYIYKTDTLTSNDALIDPRFINLSPESIRSYRNTFRQNMDYDILVFIIIWGLNIVDATVDAHLKAFDVSDDLSLKIKPNFNNGPATAGISLVLKFKDKPSN